MECTSHSCKPTVDKRRQHTGVKDTWLKSYNAAGQNCCKKCTQNIVHLNIPSTILCITWSSQILVLPVQVLPGEGIIPCTVQYVALCSAHVWRCVATESDSAATLCALNLGQPFVAIWSLETVGEPICHKTCNGSPLGRNTGSTSIIPPG